jgi:hypothetical protein
MAPFDHAGEAGCRALEARRKVNGRTTDWILVRNRLESVESSNQRQITQVLDVIQRTLGFRIARGSFVSQARERNPNRLVFRSGAPGDRVLSVAPDRLSSLYNFEHLGPH